MFIKVKKIILLLLFLSICNIAFSQNVDVTLLIDSSVDKPKGLSVAERSLSQLLTEVNRAQKSNEPVSVKNLNMDEFAKKSLARIWAVTPFYCDDEEIVERCWVFKNGDMMISHIPLIITPEDKSFGYGNYQEAIVEINTNGQITDFRFAIDSQLGESMEHAGSVVEKEKLMIILQYLERFRTAYNMKDIKTIEKIFSDDALIITGKVVNVKDKETNQYASKVEYTKQNKEQYIENLKNAFARNKWIDVKFSEIGEGEGLGGGITRSNIDPTKYGIRLKQAWRSSNYNDDGYLFLLWEFPENGEEPIIHVRTWQPEFTKGVRNKPDDNISTLGGFDL